MPVLSLLIDTADTALVVAVARDGIVRAETADATRRAQHLLAVIDEVMDAATVQRHNLDQLVCGIGPGGFTGLRIGVSTARGIATALQVPLVPVSTLASIAWPTAQLHQGEAVCARMDARRGEWFELVVSMGSDGRLEQHAPIRAVPQSDDAAAVPDDAQHLVWGPPTARGMLGVASSAHAIEPIAVVPDYGREPDARPGAWSGGIT